MYYGCIEALSLHTSLVISYRAQDSSGPTYSRHRQNNAAIRASGAALWMALRGFRGAA